MAELKLTIFNVQRGLCVFARTPTGYGVMIDCGCSVNPPFSPATWIRENEAHNLTIWGSHHLYKLIITHPHDDHVEDIQSVINELPPAVLHHHTDYDWDEVLNPPDGDASENTETFYEWQQTYDEPVLTEPDLGLTLECFALSPAEAAAIDADTQHSLNNSSFVVVFTYQPPGQSASWKVVIAGDNETSGWEELLRKPEVRLAVADADFYVTAHHGHESGFSEDLFFYMGKPMLNITSEREGDDSVFDYDPWARGVTVDGEACNHLLTCDKGHITLRLTDALQYAITCEP